MKPPVLPTILALGATAACQQALDLDEFSFAEPPQGVLWFALAAAGRQTCSWPRSYQLPDEAPETITSMTGDGDRVVDGGQVLVTCSVVPESGTDGAYDVSIQVASGEVASFTAVGQLAGASRATLAVAFRTQQFSLAANDCTATVRAVLPGAFWLQSLRCPDLRDPNHPGISCTGTGGLLFERCSE